MEEKTIEQAKSFVLKSLSRKSQLTSEIYQKLVDRGFDLLIIQKVINQCREWGYLDDQAFIEGMIKQAILRLDGPYKIAQKLRQKGVRDFECTLQKNYPESVQISNIQLLISSRYSRKTRDQKIRGLISKGYSKALIFSYISEHRD